MSFLDFIRAGLGLRQKKKKMAGSYTGRPVDESYTLSLSQAVAVKHKQTQESKSAGGGARCITTNKQRYGNKT